MESQRSLSGQFGVDGENESMTVYTITVVLVTGLKIANLDYSWTHLLQERSKISNRLQAECYADLDPIGFLLVRNKIAVSQDDCGRKFENGGYTSIAIVGWCF